MDLLEIRHLPEKYCCHRKCIGISSYSTGRLIGSLVIESADYCNHTLLAPNKLYQNSAHKRLGIWIIRLMLSLLCWPKVILLSGGPCINKPAMGEIAIINKWHTKHHHI